MKLFINHNGLKVEVNKFGNKKANLILIPGWTHNFQIETKLINLLTKRFTVYTISYPGYSESEDTPKAQSMEYLSKIIESVVSNLKLKNYKLVGFSMGCQVAINYLKKHKEIKAVLISPVVKSLEEQIPLYGKILLSSKTLLNFIRKTKFIKLFLVNQGLSSIGTITESIRKISKFKGRGVSLNGAFDTLIANVTSFIDPIEYNNRVKFIFGDKEVLQESLKEKGVKYYLIKNSGHSSLAYNSDQIAKLID